MFSSVTQVVKKESRAGRGKIMKKNYSQACNNFPANTNEEKTFPFRSDGITKPFWFGSMSFNLPSHGPCDIIFCHLKCTIHHEDILTETFM